MALLVVAGARLHIERGRKLGVALTGVANLGSAHCPYRFSYHTITSMDGEEVLGCGGVMLGIVWGWHLTPILAWTQGAMSL